jgi:hypothetical protein
MDPDEVVAADPMMRILRERHPDVNVVLLPPVEPLDRRSRATLAQCRSVQQHADTVLATVSQGLGHEPSTRVDYWWSQNHPEVRRWVTAASYADLGDEGAVPALRSLGNLLVHLGWEPRPAADGTPRVRGLAGPLELVAGAEGGVLSVHLTSDPLHIPVDLHSELGTDT